MACLTLQTLLILCSFYRNTSHHFLGTDFHLFTQLYAAIKGIPANSVKAAAADKLAQVGLSEKDSDRLSSNYSGGMRRRLSLACATIGQPQLV